MDLSTLKYAKGAKRNRKRVGRGGAHGKTAGKGHKGQLSRAGSKQRAWFEGGQMPLQRRLPKRGFKNFARVEFEVVNLAALEKLTETEITPELLKSKRLVRRTSLPIKILGFGDITRQLSVTANAFSKSAAEKIAGAGGRITIL